MLKKINATSQLFVNGDNRTTQFSARDLNLPKKTAIELDEREEKLHLGSECPPILLPLLVSGIQSNNPLWPICVFFNAAVRCIMYLKKGKT